MIRKMFLSAVLAVLALSGSSAQEYAELIRSNPAMGGANMMNYHFDKTDHTPAPRGYKPFSTSVSGLYRYFGNNPRQSTTPSTLPLSGLIITISSDI